MNTLITTAAALIFAGMIGGALHGLLTTVSAALAALPL
jgi:hypothetical protein